MATQTMSNVQLELLKIYSADIPNEELIELKNVLAGFFAEKAIKSADRIWDEKGLTNDDMDAWLNEQ
ncbi:MAG TPA: hypothetical protein PK771_00505 [Spirochaetota bacterium]|nr:hypothetical protein [Spirochaetota bacterium]